MAGHETGDSASDRPIFTLLHAGVGGCIENLLVDTIGNIEIGAVRMTRYAPMTPKQLKLRRCKLPGKQRHLAKLVHTGHPVQMPTHAARS